MLSGRLLASACELLANRRETGVIFRNTGGKRNVFSLKAFFMNIKTLNVESV